MCALPVANMLYSRKSMKIGVKVAGVHVALLVSFVSLLTCYDVPFRADIVCHWEDSDVVAQEMYYNVRNYH